MKINLGKIRELAERATQVVSWYWHGPYDGYHPGEASVRGPFCRWLIVKEGGGWDESKPKPVAEVEVDAEFAATAMNTIIPLVDEIDRLKGALIEAQRQLYRIKTADWEIGQARLGAMSGEWGAREALLAHGEKFE